MLPIETGSIDKRILRQLGHVEDHFDRVKYWVHGVRFNDVVMLPCGILMAPAPIANKIIHSDGF